MSTIRKSSTIRHEQNAINIRISLSEPMQQRILCYYHLYVLSSARSLHQYKIDETCFVFVEMVIKMQNSTPIFHGHDFPWPNERKGYDIFPDDLEKDPLVAFHGTSESNWNSIVQCGFVIQGELSSILFSKNSSLSLGYACGKRSKNSPNGVVVAVKFESLSQLYVYEDISCICLYAKISSKK